MAALSSAANYSPCMTCYLPAGNEVADRMASHLVARLLSKLDG